MDKYEIARGYRDHLGAVAADRQLESYLEACLVIGVKTWQFSCTRVFDQALDPMVDGDTLLLTTDSSQQQEIEVSGIMSLQFVACDCIPGWAGVSVALLT